MKISRKSILICLLLIFAGVLSFFTLGNKFAAPEAYRGLVSSIDKKTDDALLLTGTVTVASAAVTLLPGDVATPVAEKIADFTEYFLVALVVLYAEKYLLPIIGFTAFKFLIPAACLLFLIAFLTKKGVTASRMAIRLLSFTIILWLAIPVSIRVSDIVYNTYVDSIDSTLRDAEELTRDISIFSDSNGTAFVERATDLVNGLLQALTISIVTSCVIPILVLLLFIWLSRVLLGIVMPVPLPIGRKRPLQAAAMEGGKFLLGSSDQNKEDQ